MKKINTLALTLGLLFYVATSVVAATATDTLRHNPELRKEVRAYTRQNVIPVLREQRISFDKQLSAADKQKIAGLQQEQQRLRLQAKELHQRIKANRGAGKAPLTKAEKNQLRALREKQKQVVQRTRSIAEQYRPQLQAIQAELADERTTWAADLRAIYARYNKTSPSDSAAANKYILERPQALRLMRPVNFILWDVNRKTDKAESTDSQAYPNPSSGNFHITYSVAREGNVKITLLNANGNVVRILVNEQKTAGSYGLDVDLSSLAKGVYYYKIEAPGKTETKRLLKQ